MSETMPTGWMDAETARKWARRGVWAYRTPGGGRGTFSAEDAEDVTPHIYNGETWRYLCAHPDDLDAPAPVAVETVERWCVVSRRGDDGAIYDTEDEAWRHCDTLCHVVRVLLPLPTRVEPVTVRGEVKP